MFFDHHLNLTLPEEREEDDDKVMLTRYTPLGVVGAVSNLSGKIRMEFGLIASNAIRSAHGTSQSSSPSARLFRLCLPATPLS